MTLKEYWVLESRYPYDVDLIEAGPYNDIKKAQARADELCKMFNASFYVHRFNNKEKA